MSCLTMEMVSGMVAFAKKRSLIVTARLKRFFVVVPFFPSFLFLMPRRPPHLSMLERINP